MPLEEDGVDRACKGQTRKKRVDAAEHVPELTRGILIGTKAIEHCIAVETLEDKDSEEGLCPIGSLFTVASFLWVYGPKKNRYSCECCCAGIGNTLVRVR